MRRLAHISDLHFGAEDRVVADGLLEDLQRVQPHIIAVSGDLTQRARRSQFAAARDYLKQMPAPVLVVPGNHDIPLWNVWDRWIHPLSRFREFISSEPQPFFRDEDIAIAGINTARSNRLKEGRISMAQIKLLKSQFDSVGNDVLKVLVCHHPFIPPENSERTVLVGRVRLALRMLEACGCSLIVSGHLHHAYSGDVRPYHLEVTRSILVAQAGTAISHRRRNEANGYNLITVDNERLDLEVRAWTGTEFAPCRVRNYRRTEQGWIE